MANLSKIIKIKQQDYSTLLSEGEVEINGQVYQYDPNALYTVVDPAPPEYALTAGQATFASTASSAYNDQDGNSIRDTYKKLELTILYLSYSNNNPVFKLTPNGNTLSDVKALNILRDKKNYVIINYNGGNYHLQSSNYDNYFWFLNNEFDDECYIIRSLKIRYQNNQISVRYSTFNLEKQTNIIWINDTDKSYQGIYNLIHQAINIGDKVVIAVTLTEEDNQVVYCSQVTDDTTDNSWYYFSGKIAYDNRFCTVQVYNDDTFGIHCSEFAYENHSHGNISHDGKVATRGSLGNASRLVFVDSTNVIRSSTLTFAIDAAYSNQALSRAGTWISYSPLNLPTTYSEEFVGTAPPEPAANVSLVNAIASLHNNILKDELAVSSSLNDLNLTTIKVKGTTPLNHTLADDTDSYYEDSLKDGQVGIWYITYSNGQLFSVETETDASGRIKLSNGWISRLNYYGVTWANVGDFLLVYKYSSLLSKYKILSVNEAGETRIGLMSPNDKIEINKISGIQNQLGNKLSYSGSSLNAGNVDNGAYSNITSGRTNWINTNSRGSIISLGNLQIAVDADGRLYSRTKSGNIWNLTNLLRTITQTNLNEIVEPSVLGYAVCTNGPTNGANDHYTVYTFTSSDFDGNGYRSILQIAINREDSTPYIRTTFKNVNSGYLITTDWKKVPQNLSDLTNDVGYATESYVNNKFADVLGLNADGITALKTLVEDGNAATGILTALAGKADKATTLAGYGITDAKIQNGTITLGSNTITPITSSNLPYAGNVRTTTNANYITEPEIKSLKINGSSTNAASTENAVIQYDTTNKCIKFVFN